jgi:RNA polymerase sigma factor for flagellar operon FliA
LFGGICRQNLDTNPVLMARTPRKCFFSIRVRPTFLGIAIAPTKQTPDFLMATSAHEYPSPADAGAALRDALVLQHLPQVRLIARKIHGQLPDYVSLDDLISTGVIGLLAAIDKFDPSLDVQLGTYAERKIRGAILDGLRETDWAPREVRKKSKLIQAAIDRATQRAGRDAAEEEIAAELGIPLADYRKWLMEVKGVALEPLELAGSEKSGGWIRSIAGGEESSPSRILERAELERILALAIERIPKIERTVLHLYYFEEMNLREIGEIVGVHLSRVAQLRTQAILRLRTHLERVWTSHPGRKG